MPAFKRGQPLLMSQYHSWHSVIERNVSPQRYARMQHNWRMVAKPWRNSTSGARLAVLESVWVNPPSPTQPTSAMPGVPTQNSEFLELEGM